MAQLIQLVYVSTACELFDEAELIAQLQSFRDANQAHNITGLLLYHSGCIMQAIEGPEAAILDLYNNIQKDQRHKNIIMLLKDNITERSFSDWSMGFHALSAQDIEGFNDIFLTADPSNSFNAIKASDAKILLNSFYKHQ